MTGAGHRQVEHTADLAIELWADSEEELLREGLRALTETLTQGRAGPGHGPPNPQIRSVTIESIDSADRLVQWLNELLYLATVEDFLPLDAELELHRDGLRARVHGSPDELPATEIKSATYHDLEVVERDGRWRARVVLDV